MEVRNASNSKDVKHYTTERLREEFLITDLFTKDNVKMVYSHIDRIITAGAMPVDDVLTLEAGKELAADYFLQRREMGCINIGGAGVITVDGVEYNMNPRDGIYIGRGNKEITFNVTRKKVNQATVNYAILKGDIGYLIISSFSELTPTEVKEALLKFDEHNIKNIILDLRYNPGGHLISVVEVAKLFVPKGPIVHAVFRGSENQTFYSENLNPKYKFAVLVNGDTASAAEVLASALQDSGTGYLIGRTTYGKGLIQDVFNLKNGDAFKITTGHYLTRNGHDINKVGIEPDEVVINHTERPDPNEYTKFCYKHKWKVGETGDGVLAAKERLKIMGYYKGELNKFFDKSLEKAVYNFQRDQGLYPYGVIDFSTQATIENVFIRYDIEIDDQFEMAYTYLGGKLDEE